MVLYHAKISILKKEIAEKLESLFCSGKILNVRLGRL